MFVNKKDLTPQLIYVKKFVEDLEKNYTPFHDKLHDALKKNSNVEEVNAFVSKQWDEWKRATEYMIYARLLLGQLYIKQFKHKGMGCFHLSSSLQIIPDLQKDLIYLTEFNKSNYLKKMGNYSLELDGELETMSDFIFHKMINHGHALITNLETFIELTK